MIDSHKVTADADHLQIRGTWGGMLSGLLFGGLFIFVGLEIVSAMFTRPGTGWAGPFEQPGPMLSFSQQSLGNQIATCAFAVFFCGAFAGSGMLLIVFPMRRLVVPWRFDRRRGHFRRGRRQWNLSAIDGVCVRIDRVFGKPISISIMLDLNTGQKLRLLRELIGKKKTWFGRQIEFDVVAKQIAEWLNVPLRAN